MKYRNITYIISLILLVAVGFFFADVVLAEGGSSPSVDTVKLSNPIKGSPTIPVFLGRVITGLLGIIGSLTLVAFIYGGFIWLTSGGSSDKVKKGTQTMEYAIIGLFIIFGAYAILNTVISGLRGGPGTSRDGIPDKPDTSCVELFGNEGFQCLPVGDCAGLPADAKWQDCRNAPAGVCKVNRCGTTPNVVCCKPNAQ